MKTFLRICVVVFGAACLSLIFMRYRTYRQFMSSDWGDVQKSRQGSVKSLVHVEPERNTSSLHKQKGPKCSSLRNAAAVDLRLNFSIPLLMWAGDLDYSVNEQLLCCPLPYGLKDVPPQVVHDALTLLNEPSSNQLFDRGSLPCIRCAVVGNGGILNGSRQGKTIDSHHFVFRVNGAVTKGFEQDVGTKTSFYGFTTNSMKNSLLAYKNAGFDSVPQDQNVSYVFIPDDVRDFVMLTAAIKGISVPSGNDMGDWPPSYFGDKRTVNQFKILHPEFINYVTQQFLKSPQMSVYPDIYMPTTGALMLMLALHTCDQVSAYGFITENYVLYSDHYFDRVMQPLVFYANHDIRMEAALWADFHTKEIMSLYHR